MKSSQVIRNQKGVSALIVVMAVGTILATFMLSLQMYVTARARMVSRVRLAYKYTFVMEDAAKFIQEGREEYLGGRAAGGTCGAGTACGAGKSCQDPTIDALAVNTCLATSNSNKCLNGEACMCTAGVADAACATWVKNDFKIESMDDEMIAMKIQEEDRSLLEAFEVNLLDKVFPDFDHKYVAFVDRIFFKKTSVTPKIFNEASAAANQYYQFSNAVANPLGFGPGGVLTTMPQGTNTNVDATSPYPLNNLQAYAYRDCTANGADQDTIGAGGANRCITIRVCVSNAHEPAMGSATEVCFSQRISRSFLWPHNRAPCRVADGCLCPDPVDPENPVGAEKGTSDPVAGCTCCPWRDRF